MNIFIFTASEYLSENLGSKWRNLCIKLDMYSDYEELRSNPQYELKDKIMIVSIIKVLCFPEITFICSYLILILNQHRNL